MSGSKLPRSHMPQWTAEVATLSPEFNA